MSDLRWASDPLEPVRRQALELGLCPIGLVDEFTSEHWDVCEICSWFDCEVCVATPEDFGFGGSQDDDEVDGIQDAAIPF